MGHQDVAPMAWFHAPRSGIGRLFISVREAASHGRCYDIAQYCGRDDRTPDATQRARLAGSSKFSPKR